MRGSGVPSAGGPCLADQGTDGDDRVGEVEERVDDVFAAFVAALQPVEAVVPGVRPRSTCQRCPAWSGALWPLWAICPAIPRAASSSRVFCESYRRRGARGSHRAAARARRSPHWPSSPVRPCLLVEADEARDFAGDDAIERTHFAPYGPVAHSGRWYVTSTDPGSARTGPYG